MKGIHFLLRAIKKFKWFLAGLFVIYLGAMFFSLAMPRIQGKLIDSLTNRSMDDLSTYTLWMVVILACSVVFSFTGEVLAWLYTIRVKEELLGNVLKNVLRKQMRFYGKYDTGYMVARVYEVFRLEPLFGASIISILMTSLSCVGAAVLMLRIDLTLGLICIVMIPLYFISSYIYTKPIKKAEFDQQESMNSLTSLFISLYNAVLSFRMLNATGFFEKKFRKKGRRYFSAGIRTKFLRTQHSTLSTLASRVAPIVVLIIAGIRVIEQNMTVGVLFEFLGYLPFLYRPFDQLARFYSEFLGAKVSLDRIDTILNELPEDDEVRPKKCNGIETIALRNVDFSYEPGRPLIQELNFDLKRGDIAALTGESGKGKTTILRLLSESLVPDKGKVLINGEDYLEYSQSSKRNYMLYLPANVELFNGTVYENITMGAPFEPEQVEAALRAVNLWNKVQSLPQGWDTLYGETSELNFSEGEKQRLALARIMLRDGDLVIFDETTNNLDQDNEKAIMELIRELFAGKIVIVVSHNLKDYFGINKEISLNPEPVAV
ncbi:MAG: ABC transporter ATP-binding protein [Acidobacteriota bacterium]|nr:ABC transporter ATP-binding protein [Acidobacteriota bacterium]